MNELGPLRPASAQAPAANPLHPTAWITVRLARPARDLTRSTRFYRDLIGLPRVGGFDNHDGYDGVFFALPGGSRTGTDGRASSARTLHRRGSPGPVRPDLGRGGSH